jgi:acetyltransferase-like isoleucine patch superfamily enzyme
MYGCDIEVFKGASLIIRSGLSSLLGDGANIGLTISCANRIEMGEDVKIGRNVTIRDNNGHHLLSVRGYKESKPVIIGNHVWICEQATIMQGVKIGDGAIIGARAVVYSNVPPYSIVSGNPAQVVDENVYWKY